MYVKKNCLPNVTHLSPFVLLSQQEYNQSKEEFFSYKQKLFLVFIEKRNKTLHVIVIVTNAVNRAKSSIIQVNILKHEKGYNREPCFLLPKKKQSIYWRQMLRESACFPNKFRV
uniref:(northern house mosquito) hypothetical protein n=1 Tax=Culex pipiens TaxID=7175 RepID=A0A8D8FWR0_CULPI